VHISGLGSETAPWMRDIAADLRRWWDAGEPFALATVVGVSRSAPRAPGAAMAVGPNGVVVGSVSGGCVEGAVYELASQVLEFGGQIDGVPAAQLTTYGYSDETAFAVGLTCGGQITLLIERIDAIRTPDFGAVLADVQAGRPVAVAQVLAMETAAPCAGALEVGARLTVRADEPSGSLGTSGLDAAVTDDSLGLLSQGQTAQRHYGPHGERRWDDVTVFVASYAPPPRMLVFGAIDFAAAVARIGVFLGYRVTVCDARPVFATERRFPDAHEVVVEWPHRYLARSVAAGTIDARTVICVLTHDPKFDVPLLEVALRSAAGYVGAMGSRRTHDERLSLLGDIGVTEDELARLHSPIGLDIGARTPEETAVSIAAEIIRSRWGGSGEPLLATTGPIHRDLDRASAPALTPAPPA
jgi:xanthine dehydrogenase accessory factor